MTQFVCVDNGGRLSALPLGVSPPEARPAAVALVPSAALFLLLGNVLLALLQEVLFLLTLQGPDLDFVLLDLELLSLLEAVVDFLRRVRRRVLLTEPQLGLTLTLVEVDKGNVLWLDLIAVLETVLDVLPLGVGILESFHNQDGAGRQFQLALLSPLLSLGLFLFGLKHLLGLFVLLLFVLPGLGLFLVLGVLLVKVFLLPLPQQHFPLGALDLLQVKELLGTLLVLEGDEC